MIAKAVQPFGKADLQRLHAHDRRNDDYRGKDTAGSVMHDHMVEGLALIFLAQGTLFAHAASSSRAAWARASSVIAAPDSIRAISSRRSSGVSLRTVVRVAPSSCAFSIR